MTLREMGYTEEQVFYTIHPRCEGVINCNRYNSLNGAYLTDFRKLMDSKISLDKYKECFLRPGSDKLYADFVFDKITMFLKSEHEKKFNKDFIGYIK